MATVILFVGLLIGFALGWVSRRRRAVRLMLTILDATPRHPVQYRDGVVDTLARLRERL